MNKKIVSFLFSVVLLLNVVGCGNGSSNSASGKSLSLGDSSFAYTVIYSDDNADVLSNPVSNLSLAVKKNLSRSVKSKSDSKIKKNPENTELLIGDTNRSESQEAMALIEKNRKNNFNDAIVIVIGNKIVLQSKNMDVLCQTVDWFADTFLKDEAAWSMLKDDYKYIYEYEDTVDYKIGDNSILNYSIVMKQDSSLVYGIYAEQLQALIKEKCCYDIPLETDENEPNEYEIIIGKCSREDTQVSLSKNQYTVFVKGNRLFALGADDEATAFAAKKIIDLFSNENGGKIAIDYNLTDEFVAADDDYKLVYSDEFNGNTLNRNYWTEYSNRKDGKNQFGKTSHALGNSKVFLRDGMAVLPAWIDTNTWETYNSSLEYENNHFWQYGIVEIRAKWAGFATTYSFWAHSLQDDYGEFKAPGITVEYDMLENFGQNSSFSSNLHRWWKDKSASWKRHISLDGTVFSDKKRFSLPKGEKFDDKFHTFAMRWSPEEIDFAVDGKTFFKYDLTEDLEGYGNEAFLHPINRLHITCSIGNPTSYNKVSWQEGDPTSYEYLVDYYRIYQRNADGGFSKMVSKSE